MSSYTKITDFGRKDDLAVNDPNKIIQGSEFDAEFNAIATAIASKTETVPVYDPIIQPNTELAQYDYVNPLNNPARIQEDSIYSEVTFIPTDGNNKLYLSSFINYKFDVNVADITSVMQGEFRFFITNLQTNTEFSIPSGNNNNFKFRKDISGTTPVSITPADGAFGSADEIYTHTVDLITTQSFIELAGASNAGYFIQGRVINYTGQTTGNANLDRRFLDFGEIKVKEVVDYE